MALDYTVIGKRIKVKRLEKGLSQVDLGDIVRVNSEHISRIETGKKPVTLDLLVLIANALDVSADDLLVENLTRTSSPVGQELHAILQDCNHDEKEMLIRLLKFMKELFREFSI